MGYWLTLSSLAQIIWVYIFLSRWFFLSVVAMIAILIPLIVLYLRLDIALEPLTFKQKWLVNFPISLYLGWISIATIVNIASALDFAGWNQWGITDINWTIMMILIGGIIAIWIRLQHYDKVYCGVFVWTFIAISIRHLDIISIAATAGILGFLLILLMLMPQLKLANRKNS
ncbi:hypothetical protein [Aphanothece sacrum]|uniref:Membrane protein n=1 Tax=Aphanothece sacrum FPU1 TaxID=1920663 RepID=A0A401IN26_APHSA|nr:hypothetical protein [Aphanothece sacrum]GBF82649.1 membrane protein [Aphanothece sacrum FPU1]GBF86170.1 membrane protein [Aphanothece sacrum FPU3]